jgi:hypothetical protein
MDIQTKPAAGGIRRAGLNQYTQPNRSTDLICALRWRKHSPADAAILAARRALIAERRGALAQAVEAWPHDRLLCRYHAGRMVALRAVTP